MTGNRTPPGPDVRALPGAPRATRIARLDRTSNLTASGYGYHQTTKMARTSLSTARREIGRTLARGSARAFRLGAGGAPRRGAEARRGRDRIRRIEGGRDLFARDRRARPLSRVSVREPAASPTERRPDRCPTHPAEALTSAAPPASDDPSAANQSETQRNSPATSLERTRPAQFDRAGRRSSGNKDARRASKGVFALFAPFAVLGASPGALRKSLLG
jgi:hypothetical protein